MRPPFPGVFGVVLLSFCLHLSADSVQGLPPPPPPRNRQEVEAVLAQAPKGPPVSDLRPLQIVLVANRKDHGPQEHDYPRWLERWKVLLGGKEAGTGQVNLFGSAYDLSQGPPPGAARVKVQAARDWLRPEQWAQADLVVAFFGTGGIWNQAKLRDLKAFLVRGGGLVAVHSAVIAEKPHARPLAEFMGLAWENGYTLFRVGPLDLEIADRQHPICKGLPAKIHFEDEAYWPLVGDPGRIHLLATSQEKAKETGRLQPEPMFWTYSAGKGRVFSCILGHYNWTFDDPYFRILLLRGMAWAAKESPYRFDPLVLCGARTSGQKRAAAAIPPGAAPVAPIATDPNLLLWLDASDKATLTTAADGRVSAWSNKAVKVGRKLTSAGKQRPLYVAKALGGHPALRFDGIDDVLRDTGFGQSARTWTVGLVFTPRSNTGSGQFHALLATNRPRLNDFLTGLNVDLGPGETPEFSALNLEGIKDFPGATNLRTETAPFGEGQVVILSTGKTRSRLWINGTEEEGRAANDALTAMDELRIGGRFYLNGERGFFHGDMAEVLIYKTELTEAARAGLQAYLLKKYGPEIKQPVAYTLPDAWDYLPRYDWGKSRRPLEPIDEAIRNSQGNAQVRMTLESRLVDGLEDPIATTAARDYICRRLAMVGSAASVTALARLLKDEKLSHMACFALERIPGPAAEDALRQALRSVHGKLRIGLIHALGNRRSQSAVADLVPLLNGKDSDTRQAAAAALGTIGGPAATRALTEALARAPVSERANLADSCLKCAEQFRTAGQQAEARALYERLRAPDVPKAARMAATRGILRINQP